MTWWRRIWRQAALERELDTEIRFHLDQHASDLVARGIDRREAVRRAHLDLGGPEQVKDQCRDVRGTRWLNDLLYDLKFAFRGFRKLPGFAAVALVILALGIAATTVMFTVINGVLLRPLSYPEPDRLVAVHAFTEAFGETWGFSYPDFTDLRDASHALTTAAWTYGGGTITEPRTPEDLNGRQISAELCTVLSLPLVHGRAFRIEEDRPGAPLVAIISYELWQPRWGGNASAVGQRLAFEGKSFTVVGGAPARVGL